MRTLWKGNISFGLVNIPVRLYPATRHRDISFNLLHATCHSPIRYAKLCPKCNAEVTKEEIVRGFPVEDGRYVVVTDEDLANLPVPTAHTVEILEFVGSGEIDPVYFERTYYLEPQPGGGRAYALLRQAMRETGKVGVAKVALRAKETLAAVRVHGPGLLLSTMFYHDEVLPLSELTGLPEEAPVGERELKMAVALIDHLGEKFEPEKYENTAGEALRKLIQAKVEGEVVTAAPAARAGAEVIDLMTALQESLARTGGKTPQAEVPAGSVAGARVRRPRRKVNGEAKAAPKRAKT